MTTFMLIAAVMVAVALACVLVPLLRIGKGDTVARDMSNVAIVRDQVRELEADLAAGTISQDRHDEARRELDRRVLDDAAGTDITPRAPTQAAAWTAALLASAIPIAALLLYAVLGSHEAFSPATAAKGEAGHEVTRQQVEEMAAKLATRLEKEPSNLDGWVMLARTYDALGRHSDATGAFERAVTLAPENAQVLADYADSLGAAQGGLHGKAVELIERALKADPTQWKALALAGTVAFERKDYGQAVVYWERLKTSVPPNSPIAGSIDSSIAEARNLGGQAVAKATTATKAEPSPSPSGATIAGTVTIAPSVASKVSPSDTVFIFARATEGPKMPLAILRKQVKDLPLAFTLDDSLAMRPEFALSKFATVNVTARVSKSGGAAPQSGDLEGSSEAVKTGATGVAIVIDRALP